MAQPDNERIKGILSGYEQRYRASARRWKTWYRVLLVSSALCSASAAIIGKLEYLKYAASSDMAAIMAGLATVITTLIAALDFEVNARVNRRSRHEVSLIILESEKSTAKADELLGQLQQVVKDRDQGVGQQD